MNGISAGVIALAAVYLLWYFWGRTERNARNAAQKQCDQAARDRARLVREIEAMPEPKPGRVFERM